MFVTFFAHGSDITLNVNSDNLKVCLEMIGQDFDYSGVIPVTQLRKTLIHLYMYNPLDEKEDYIQMRYEIQDKAGGLERILFYYKELEKILSFCIAHDTYLIWG